MRVKFRGKTYSVTYRKTLPNRDEVGVIVNKGPAVRRIGILQSLSGLERLDTEIHEALHACLWDLDEHAVNESASDIARFLWRLGYRLPEPD